MIFPSQILRSMQANITQPWPYRRSRLPSHKSFYTWFSLSVSLKYRSKSFDFHPYTQCCGLWTDGLHKALTREAMYIVTCLWSHLQVKSLLFFGYFRLSFEIFVTKTASWFLWFLVDFWGASSWKSNTRSFDYIVSVIDLFI